MKTFPRVATIAAIMCLLLISLTVAKESVSPLWEHAPETISPAWRPILTARGKTRQGPMPAPSDITGWQKMQAAKEQFEEAMADNIARKFEVTYELQKLGGVPVNIVTPAAVVSAEKIAVYTHGGAYVLNSAKGCMSSMAIFAHATGLKVVGVDYTLAPHAKWREIVNEVVAVFKALEKQGYEMKDIVLYGDSAGGSLAAGAALKMRDQGVGMPAALVLWSPWMDISETGDTYVTLRDAEPYYTYKDVLGPAALAYADEQDHKHPYVSPVYGDFSKGFPPTLIQGGTKEIFLSNFVRFYQSLDQAGQTVKLDLYEGMPHVHVPTLPDTTESKAAMVKVKAWVAKHLLKKK